MRFKLKSKFGLFLILTLLAGLGACSNNSTDGGSSGVPTPQDFDNQSAETEPFVFFMTSQNTNLTTAAYYQDLNGVRTELEKPQGGGQTWSVIPQVRFYKGYLHAWGQYDNKAAYWRNGVLVDLHRAIPESLAATWSSASLLTFADNGDTLIQGSYRTNNNTRSKAGYWRIGGGEVRFINLHPDNGAIRSAVRTFNVASDGTVRIAGQYGDMDNVTRAAYWQDGEFTDLDSLARSSLSAAGSDTPEYGMQVAGNGDVVIRGVYTTAGSSADKALYWRKTGGEWRLTNLHGLIPNSPPASLTQQMIVQNDGSVIFRGYYKTDAYNVKAALWQGDRFTDLHAAIDQGLGAKYSETGGMSVAANGDITVIGNYRTESPDPSDPDNYTENNKLCYWKNGAFTNLNPSNAQSSAARQFRFLPDGGLRIAGNYYGNDNVTRAAYWQDANMTDLHQNITGVTDLKRSRLTDFYDCMYIADNGDVIIRGEYGTDLNYNSFNKTGYWRNGVFTNLNPADAKSSLVNAFLVSPDGTVHVSAQYVTETDNVTRAAYWRNEKMTDLHAAIPADLQAIRSETFYDGLTLASDGSVIVRGRYRVQGDGTAFRAGYWKDGAFTNLHGEITPDKSATYSDTAGLYSAAADDIIVTGYYRTGDSFNKAAYWRKGVFTDLHNEGDRNSWVRIVLNQ